MADVKLWQMNESEVFAAETAEQALEAMAELYCYETTPEGIAGLRAEYGIDDDYPAEIDEDLYDQRKVNVENCCGEDGEEERLITYREHLAQIVADGDAPCLFSTTEY